MKSLNAVNRSGRTESDPYYMYTWHSNHNCRCWARWYSLGGCRL